MRPMMTYLTVIKKSCDHFKCYNIKYYCNVCYKHQYFLP